VQTYRSIVAACLIIAALQIPTAIADDVRSPAKVSFYFAAHQDDWQLFMNPSAFQDVADTRTKTVFVHLTAGDAGLGTGKSGRKHPYFLARENGAETAIRFMADSGDEPLAETSSPMEFNGHPISRRSYRNTVTYFLRVPDGNPSGSGYAQTGHQSLERLATGRIDSLAAIDGSTVYHGWADLVGTLRAILDHERERAPLIQLNVAEQDPRRNPNDHSDHRMTAKAALAAAQGLGCARRQHYINYASSELPENLSAEERDMESSVLAVTAAGILALDHTSIWQAYHRSYLGRNYFRVEDATGRCEDTAPDLQNAMQAVARRQSTPASKRP
jgi:hypothetical protein